MGLNKKLIKYYFSRLYNLGVGGIYKRIKYKLRKKFFLFKVKYFIKNGYGWDEISHKYKFSKEFKIFFKFLKKSHEKQINILCEEIKEFLPPELKDKNKSRSYGSTSLTTNENKIIESANNLINTGIYIWGTGPLTPVKNPEVWHKDSQVCDPHSYSALYPSIHPGFANATPGTRDERCVENPARPECSPPENVSKGEQPDIKFPWELSRLNFLFTLGWAYKITQDKKYFNYGQELLSSWLTHNPYLEGVNWTCPMECALRSISIIWFFYLTGKQERLDYILWEKIINSLYNHAQYIFYNLETFDKPNNHLISDLVGLIYIYNFFGDIKARDKILKLLDKEILHQINPDGSCYEGSTCYHRLDTQLITHIILLSNTYNFSLSSALKERYTLMCKFLSNCHDNTGNISQIGDNDSGYLLALFVCNTGCKSYLDPRFREDDSCAIPTSFPCKRESRQHFHLFPRILLSPRRMSCLDPRFREDDSCAIPTSFPCKRESRQHFHLFPRILLSPRRMSCLDPHFREDDGCANPNVKTYPYFGLTILRDEKIYFTFRHPVYNKKQPTGHFHQDFLSFTLAINGHPVFIDPGSYCYTKNIYLRNYFRSFDAHNTFYISDMGTIENDPKTLFSLQISQNKFSGQITQQDNTFTLYDYYKVNLDPGLRRDPGNTTSYIHEWFSSRRKLCLDARIREHDVNGACLHRKIIYHKEEKKILIQDWYLQNNNLKTPVNLNWAFNLAPQIKVLEDKNLWKLFSQDTPLCILHSTLPLKLTTGLFSPNYSEKQSCAKLTAQITQDFNIHQTVITIL